MSPDERGSSEKTYWDELRCAYGGERSRHGNAVSLSGAVVTAMQAHPQWTRLRDAGGRTGAMWAVVRCHETWRALRKQSPEIAEMIEARDDMGRSLWFYVARSALPYRPANAAAARRRAMQNGGEPTPAPDDRWEPAIRWLLPQLPNPLTADGTGLMTDACSFSAQEAAKAVRSTKPIELEWVKTVQAVTKWPAAHWWGGPVARQEEAAACLWDSLKGIHEPDGSTGGSLRDRLGVVVGHAVASFSPAVWRTVAAHLTPRWRTALGAACVTAHTNASLGDPPTSVLMQEWLDILWCRPEWPGARFPVLGSRAPDVWAQLEARITESELSQTLEQPSEPNGRSSRLRL